MTLERIGRAVVLVIAAVMSMTLGGCGGGTAASTSSAVPTATDGIRRALSVSATGVGAFKENGWFWNPQEGGTGFMFEAQGDQGFVAFFLYEEGTGRPVWYAAGGQFVANTDGSFSFSGDLRYYTAGQSVHVPTYISPQSRSVGSVQILFSGINAAVQLPGRFLAATRYDFGGLTGTNTASQPEAGWYWNRGEGGRGYAIEVQNNKVFAAIFHYNEDGSPTWNVVDGDISTGVVSNAFQLFSGGQTLVSKYRSPTDRFDLGTFTISFRNPCAGQIQLAGVAPVSIRRFTFGDLPPGAECRAAAGTLEPSPISGVMEPGDAVFGVIDSIDDVNVYRVALKSGVSYQFDLLGANTEGGTLVRPSLKIYDDNFQPLASGTATSGFPGRSEVGLLYSTSANGNYYLAVSTADSGIGTFLLSASGVADGLNAQPAVPLSSYMGRVNGGLKGREQGTFSLSIDAAGSAAGIAVIPGLSTTPLLMVGSVREGGIFRFTASGSNVIFRFDGFLGPQGDLSGTWSDSTGAGGLVVGLLEAPAPAPGSWSKIADQGATVVVGKATTVRYGSDTRWTQMVVSARMQCTAEFFGSDPAPGAQKQCEGSQVGTTPLLAVPTLPAGTWSRIANDGASYTLSGTRIVRYGAGSNWLLKQDSGTLVCNSETFAGNPAPLATRQCDVFVPSAASVATAAVGGGPNVDVTKIPPSNFGTSNARVGTTSFPPSVSSDGVSAFRSGCNYSHMAFDDPIVRPGQPGTSHLHVFFGNTDIDGNSTATSIATTGGSTCSGGTLNRTGYWVPAAVDTRDGTPLQPSEISVYYKSGYLGVAPSSIRAIPPGLRMVAGDAKATSPTQWGPVSFTCHATGSRGYSIPNCEVGDDVVMHIDFPQCWDGVNLDSPDHKSHMKYASFGCPSSHPVAIPLITYNVHYTVKEANSAQRWRLSSDNYDTSTPAGYSLHGDYFVGWDTSIMNTWITRCLQAGMDCHGDLLGDGRVLF